jgi:hypothetical protein
LLGAKDRREARAAVGGLRERAAEFRGIAYTEEEVGNEMRVNAANDMRLQIAESDGDGRMTFQRAQLSAPSVG